MVWIQELKRASIRDESTDTRTEESFHEGVKREAKRESKVVKRYRRKSMGYRRKSN
jgi:hypothetical protein